MATTTTRLTGNQRRLLAFLLDNDSDKITADKIGKGVDVLGEPIGFDAAYACIKRLESRKLIRRFKPFKGSRAATFAITAAGKKAMGS